MLENCFEPVGKDGWPSISAWNMGDHLNLGGTSSWGKPQVGENLKLEVIIQCMGNIPLDYNLNLGISLSKEINNILGGGGGGRIPQFNFFVPPNSRKPYLGSMNPT
jgi:hypothetical protein